jgi:hypothetical protein
LFQGFRFACDERNNRCHLIVCHSKTRVAIDLEISDPALLWMKLYDPARKEALVLLRYTYFSYENVLRDEVLKFELSGDDDSDGHYGDSNSATRFWAHAM